MTSGPLKPDPTKVYVVATGRWRSGDIVGVSVTADRIWFQHVSSSLSWLKRDTTDGWSDRKHQLQQAYPDGYEVIVVGPDDALPPEIAHHFNEGTAVEKEA